MRTGLIGGRWKGKPEPAPIDGLTGDQRFFLAWAQIWRAKTRPEFTRLLVNVDPARASGVPDHRPAVEYSGLCPGVRVQAGDPMVRPENQTGADLVASAGAPAFRPGIAQTGRRSAVPALRRVPWR